MLGQRYTLPPMPSALQAAACPAHHQACLDEGAEEGGGAGEGRPEQKVRTGREFKEMFLHTAAAVNGSVQAPVRLEWEGAGGTGSQR